MNTYLPYKSFLATANILDTETLEKQRRDAKEVYLALCAGDKLAYPVVRMWDGYERWLCSYGLLICGEYQERGYHTEDLLAFFQRESDKIDQEWVGQYWPSVVKSYHYRPSEGAYVLYDGVRDIYEPPTPPWLGDEEFHKRQREELLNLKPEYYSKFFNR